LVYIHKYIYIYIYLESERDKTYLFYIHTHTYTNEKIDLYLTYLANMAFESNTVAKMNENIEDVHYGELDYTQRASRAAQAWRYHFAAMHTTVEAHIPSSLAALVVEFVGIPQNIVAARGPDGTWNRFDDCPPTETPRVSTAWIRHGRGYWRRGRGYGMRSICRDGPDEADEADPEPQPQSQSQPQPRPQDLPRLQD
jgi:hypothetical protein